MPPTGSIGTGKNPSMSSRESVSTGYTTLALHSDSADVPFWPSRTRRWNSSRWPLTRTDSTADVRFRAFVCSSLSGTRLADGARLCPASDQRRRSILELP